MIVDGFECEQITSSIDLSQLGPDKVLAGVIDGHLVWQGSAPTECLVIVTMPSSAEPVYHVGETRPHRYVRTGPMRTDAALMSRLEAERADIPCSAYDPSGPGAGIETDGYSQCATCGFTKTEHVLTLTVEEDEIIAALHVFDAQYQVATTDRHGFRQMRPASKDGMREVFFLAGAEWYKRRIEAQLAGRSDAATTTDDGDSSTRDRTGE